ncbi:MAG: 3-methyladenine DNA glycosylase, partial [Comamonadaceae bacterium]
VGQALAVDASFNGLPLDCPPFDLQPAPELPEIAVGVRIGISKARDMPWRFGLRGSRFVSRRFP